MAEQRPDPPSASSRRRTGRQGGGTLVLVLVVVLPLLAAFLPTAILLGVGMVPTLVAFIIDRDPEKTAPLTVGAMNIVGVMVPILQLWKSANTVQAAVIQLSHPLTLMMMYLAAAVGWGIYYGVPPAVAGFVTLRAENRIAKLEQEQKELVEEWGPEIAGEG